MMTTHDALTNAMAGLRPATPIAQGGLTLLPLTTDVVFEDELLQFSVFPR